MVTPPADDTPADAPSGDHRPASSSVPWIQLAELDAAERGFLLGLLLSATGDDDPLTTTNLGGAAGARCAELAPQIAALPRADRLHLLSVLAREALAPVPAGLENVHPEVLSDLLLHESTDVLLAVAAQAPPLFQRAVAQVVEARRAPPPDVKGGHPTDGVPASGRPDPGRNEAAGSRATASPEMLTTLLRALLAPVVAVPPPPLATVPRRVGRRLACLSSEALLSEVIAAGADLLGKSLRGAGEDTLQRAVAHVGPDWSPHVVHAARGGGAADDRGRSDDDRERARQIVAGTTPGPTARGTLERLGVRALVHRLRDEDPEVILSVVQRLPSGLGDALLEAARPVDPR